VPAAVRDLPLMDCHLLLVTRDAASNLTWASAQVVLERTSMTAAGFRRVVRRIALAISMTGATVATIATLSDRL
jgi:hypothetical protein